MGRLFALLFTIAAVLLGGSLLATRLFEIGERAGYSEIGSLAEFAERGLP